MKKIFSIGTMLSLLALPLVVGAATTVVTPSNMQGWGFAAETGNGTGSIVVGPAGGLGSASANLLTDSGDDGTILGVFGYIGFPFSDIDTLSYKTYVDATSATTVQTIALQFNADDDVTDGDMSWKGRLVFEPYYTEVVTKGEWQTWDPKTQGKWWGTGAVIAAECSIGSPCTWAELLGHFPDVGVNSSFGGVLFKAGSGWPAPFNGNVDALVINDDVYNFELDGDGDGVTDDGTDLCPGTVADTFLGWGDKQAKNRWMLNNSFAWVVNGKPNTQGGFAPTIEDTYGCSGIQILAAISEETGLDFDGHYKYGVTKSIIEAWIAGEYYVGPTYLETVVVDSALIGGADSVAILDDETDYFLYSSGEWTNRPGETVDTKYTTMDGWITWFDAPVGGYPEDLLDLQVDQQFLDWGSYDGTNHKYEMTYSPSVDGVLNLRVFDGDVNTNTPDPGWYGDNVGSLSVDIYEDLWVDLW